MIYISYIAPSDITGWAPLLRSVSAGFLTTIFSYLKN